MMEKAFKYKSKLFKKEITFILDEKLDKHKGKVMFPQKLEEANRLLRNLKTPLPR